MSILIVEDEEPIRKLLQLSLNEAGFSVRMATTGEEALRLVQSNPPELILLDWMLPETSGIEVLRELRKNQSSRDLPIIMLTARATEIDRIQGLDYGADDYVSKPFSAKELVARVHALLRRVRQSGDVPSTSSLLTHGDIRMDIADMRVSRAGQQLHLGPTEFRLLQHFLKSPGRVFSRAQLLDHVWGPSTYVDERTVDVHIRRLRKALEIGGTANVIRTVRSIGYALEKLS